MAAAEVQIINEGGEIVVSGSIGAPGATADYVLTADGEGGTSWEAGGGSSPYTYTGSGNPLGVQDAAEIGDTYLDESNGGAWFANATGTEGWVITAGSEGESLSAGVISVPGTAAIQDGNGGSVSAQNGGATAQAGILGASVNINSAIGPAIVATDNGEDTELGFFGQAAVVRPVLTSLSTTAEIVAALQALGLSG